MSSLAVATCAGAVGGCSWWFASGVLTVERADAAARLGVLPHAAWLVVSVTLGSLTAFLLQRFTRLNRIEGWFYPLFCTATAVLPWLPLPVPAGALLWAGPSAWLVFGGVAAAIAVTIARAGRGATPTAARRLIGSPRAAWTAAALAAVVYGVTAAYLSPLFPGGDEPHYLVITQSLIEDGDIRIENNHEERDYLAYFEAELAPHSLRRGRNGEMYSVHAPGLPAILVPAFAAGGYPAVVAFL
ncbi:MAG: hypothetical protein EHM13_14830, partial [Acidobacteria bacterium]